MGKGQGPAPAVRHRRSAASTHNPEHPPILDPLDPFFTAVKIRSESVGVNALQYRPESLKTAAGESHGGSVDAAPAAATVCRRRPRPPCLTLGERPALEARHGAAARAQRAEAVKHVVQRGLRGAAAVAAAVLRRRRLAVRRSIGPPPRRLGGPDPTQGGPVPPAGGPLAAEVERPLARSPWLSEWVAVGRWNGESGKCSGVGPAAQNVGAQRQSFQHCQPSPISSLSACDRARATYRPARDRLQPLPMPAACRSALARLGRAPGGLARLAQAVGGSASLLQPPASKGPPPAAASAAAAAWLPRRCLAGSAAEAAESWETLRQSFTSIGCEVDEAAGTAVLTLDRPQALNALNSQVW